MPSGHRQNSPRSATLSSLSRWDGPLPSAPSRGLHGLLNVAKGSSLVAALSTAHALGQNVAGDRQRALGRDVELLGGGDDRVADLHAAFAGADQAMRHGGDGAALGGTVAVPARGPDGGALDDRMQDAKDVGGSDEWERICRRALLMKLLPQIVVLGAQLLELAHEARDDDRRAHSSPLARACASACCSASMISGRSPTRQAMPAFVGIRSEPPLRGSVHTRMLMS